MIIEFVSYTGTWPNLCSGVLTLKIDGNEVKFGNDDYDTYQEYVEDKNPPNFWHISPWGIVLYYNMIPEEYQKYMSEILEVFSFNVNLQIDVRSKQRKEEV